jgi:PmbA protein
VNNPASEFGLDPSQLEAIVRRALDDAAGRGASQAEAGVSLGTGLSVTVRRGSVETLEHQRDRSFSLTVYFGQKKGSASTSDLSDAAIGETVAKACSIARYTAEDPCAGLADRELMAVDPPDLELDHPWPLTPDEAIALATDCEQAGLDADERISNSEGGSLNTSRGLRVYGNSHGFLGGYPSTSHSLSCVLVAGEGDAMERDYWYSSARDPGRLDSAEAVGRRAAERTLMRLGASRLSTRTAPVIFPAELARGLVGHFVSAILGSSQYRQASFLLGAVGEQIFPDFVRMAEQPHIPAAAASVPFDNEGVATRERDIVSDGVLQSYILGSYSARRLGLQTTGNAGGIHNLVVSDGGRDRDGLLKAMDTGFLVNELMGQGVNIVTGDYSRGASGFWVEGGEIVHAVSEVTIAGNLRNLFRNLVEIGNDVDTRGGVRCGSILLEEMTIAGT